VTITVYGADWCEDTRRSQRLLRRLHVAHRYVDVDSSPEGLERARALNGGKRQTPTIDLGLGGDPLVVPDNDVLTEALVERQMLTRDEAHERLALQNVGDVERVARTAGGLALLMLSGTLPSGMRWPLRVLGLTTAATGVTGWCPAYFSAGVTSIGGPGDRPDEAERPNWLSPRTHAADPPPTTEGDLS